MTRLTFDELREAVKAHLNEYGNAYESPPMLIGKHEWRTVVRPYYLGKMSSVYQWRRFDPGAQYPERWQDQSEWPSYNFNDGCYLGLPRTLRKLWDKHKHEINRALALPLLVDSQKRADQPSLFI